MYIYIHVYLTQPLTASPLCVPALADIDEAISPFSFTLNMTSAPSILPFSSLQAPNSKFTSLKALSDFNLSTDCNEFATS